jgi:hypothetical protein
MAAWMESRPARKSLLNFGRLPGVMPSMSWITSTWPSQCGPAPMPMTGWIQLGRDAAAKRRGTPSSTSRSAPAASTASASANTLDRPLPARDPGCGSRRTCAPTAASGPDGAHRNRARSTRDASSRCAAAPSILTMAAPPCPTSRAPASSAVGTSRSAMNGRSATSTWPTDRAPPRRCDRPCRRASPAACSNVPAPPCPANRRPAQRRPRRSSCQAKLAS